MTIIFLNFFKKFKILFQIWPIFCNFSTILTKVCVQKYQSTFVFWEKMKTPTPG